MYKTTVKIEGMACGMCESHVNDTVRKNFTVKKVTSSYKKGLSEIISEQPLGDDNLRNAINPTGYQVLEIHSEPYVKKGLFGR